MLGTREFFTIVMKNPVFRVFNLETYLHIISEDWYNRDIADVQNIILCLFDWLREIYRAKSI